MRFAAEAAPGALVFAPGCAPGAGCASFRVPAALPDMPAALDVQLLAWAGRRWPAPAAGAAAVSGVLSVLMHDGARELRAAALPAPAVVGLPVWEHAVNASGGLPLCVYWDEDAGAWSGEGCVAAAANATHVECACLHLTDFASVARLPALELPPLPDRPTDAALPSQLPHQWTLIAVVVCTVAAGALAALAAVHVDRWQDARWAPALEEAPPPPLVLSGHAASLTPY